ncbi:alpha-ketoacid dehydrogenase subunit beta [Candidatus Woesearchaeota archaeon]|nr:alpha-ketoacid dehydrogenase subunit beta [Candidatus Woesearchaeota archaeon]
MANLNIVDAINLGLKQEMQKDKRVVIFGEDVGKDGGVFRVTDGLQKLYGIKRVFDTPLCESGIVGMAIGMSAFGLRPVAEIQFEGFSYPALDQLITHASRIRNRSRGRFSCPLVIRCPWGGGVKALEHHSEAPETYYIHTPGLKVVIPSTPYDAKGLIVSAIRDENPVIFFEPKKVYRAIKEEVPEKEYTIPIGKAKIAKEGSDVSVITYGSSVRDCLKVAETLQDKYNLEVIDLRTLSPLDTDSIINSVKKTGRAVIVHEAQKTLGLGAEIIARINEKALLSLEAPVERVTGYDIIVPLPKREDLNRPTEKRIIKAIEKVMNF